MAVFAMLIGPLVAAEPVVVRLPERVAAGSGVSTVGQVARLSGGDSRVRQKMAALDLADPETETTVTKRQVEFRLKLAGFTDKDFVLVGADRLTLDNGKKRLSDERLVAVAKDELARRLGRPADELFLDVVNPVVVKLPEVRPGDDVEITAAPNGGTVRLGRTQMNVTVRVNGEHKIALPVHLNATPITSAVVPASATVPVTPAALKAADPVVVKAGQRVTMTAQSGVMKVQASGEAMQDGRVGQPIKVINVESKKTITGTVSGPGAVDIELGGDR
jgi:hypothetical protein